MGAWLAMSSIGANPPDISTRRTTSVVPVAWSIAPMVASALADGTAEGAVDAAALTLIGGLDAAGGAAALQAASAIALARRTVGARRAGTW